MRPTLRVPSAPTLWSLVKSSIEPLAGFWSQAICSCGIEGISFAGAQHGFEVVLYDLKLYFRDWTLEHTLLIGESGIFPSSTRAQEPCGATISNPGWLGASGETADLSVNVSTCAPRHPYRLSWHSPVSDLGAKVAAVVIGSGQVRGDDLHNRADGCVDISIVRAVAIGRSIKPSTVGAHPGTVRALHRACSG